GPSPLDRFLAGDRGAISESARRGLTVFLSTDCTVCHVGPMLTNEGFQIVALPDAPGAPIDPGRASARAIIASNPFNLKGAFADPVGIPDADDLTDGF